MQRKAIFSVRSLLLLAALGAPAAAQATHDVQLLSLSYSPKNLTVQLGDTVRWSWAAGFHDVLSGANGVPDGSFASDLTSEVGFVFEVTFDQAFVAANPMPGSVYPYFCSIHEPLGMTGTVRVELPSSLSSYGCGVNPAASLVRLSGSTTLGDTLELGIDNPAGTQPAGSLAFVLAASAPDPSFPCGTLIPGLGMSGPTGELLISLLPPDPLALVGPELWSGPGTFAPLSFPMPSNPAFLGLRFYLQGVLIDPGGGAGLTVGQELVLGNVWELPGIVVSAGPGTRRSPATTGT